MRVVRFSLLLAGVMLSACSQSEVKENLGLTRQAPDEFRVVARPPLSVPREFFLPPPSAGKGNEGRAMESSARALVTGHKVEIQDDAFERQEAEQAESAAPIVAAAPLSSAAEEHFLQRAGVDKADPSIREKLYNEHAAYTEEEPGLIGQLRGEGAGDPVVDAKAEAERLKKNKDENKPVTEGEVPVKDPENKTTLERIFE